MCSLYLYVNNTSIKLFKEKATHVVLTHSGGWESLFWQKRHTTGRGSRVPFLFPCHLPTVGCVLLDQPLHPLWISVSFWWAGSIFFSSTFQLWRCDSSVQPGCAGQAADAPPGHTRGLRSLQPLPLDWTLLWGQNRLVRRLSLLSVLLVSASSASEASSSAAPIQWSCCRWAFL